MNKKPKTKKRQYRNEGKRIKRQQKKKISINRTEKKEEENKNKCKNR